MNDLKAYANSLKEGDNITITADFIDTLKSACEDLEILEILKNHLFNEERVVESICSKVGVRKRKVKSIEVAIYSDEEDYRKLKELLK